MTIPELVDRARAVLDTNWTGRYTTPATGLYPHQWSWDSAFIAIGLRHLWPDRARSELTSLFDAQWADGRVPQIVYDTAREDDYQPGATFWNSLDIPGAGPAPSAGLIQPPNHAWAAWLVHCADPEGSRREGFLDGLYGKLTAWHAFLAEGRTHGDSGLAAVVHPWESGTDNSPLWDEALAETPREQRAIPRPDLEHAAPSERPSQREYGAYYWLARRYRDQMCRHGGTDWPFLMEDPAFNALWAQSERHLALIAREVGANPDPHADRAEQVAGALGSLYREDLGLFVARDVHRDRLVVKATVNGLVPLMLPELDQAQKVLATLRGPRFLDGRALMVPSYDASAPDHDPSQYWRGPAWFNMTWMVVQGLRAHDDSDLARSLAAQMAELAVAGDFPEYVNPWTGSAHGTRKFSWTAALALDLASESV